MVVGFVLDRSGNPGCGWGIATHHYIISELASSREEEYSIVNPS